METAQPMHLPLHIPSPRWLKRLSQLLRSPVAFALRRKKVAPGGSRRPQLCVTPDDTTLVRRMGTSTDVARRKDNILGFPPGGSRALARLAHELAAALDRHVGGESEEHDAVLLVLTTGSAPRLRIDSTAHVEHFEGQSKFRVVLGEDLDTRVSLETSRYDKAKQFAWEYLLATHVPCPKDGRP